MKAFEQQGLRKISSIRGTIYPTIQKILEEYIHEGRVLEVGCGSGLISLELKARRPSVQSFLCEIDLNSLLSARNNFRQHGLQSEGSVLADTHNLPFRDKSFDYIFNEGVIEHLDHLEQAIQEMCRTCGREVITFWPSGDDIVYRLKKWLRRRLRIWPYDRYGFERDLRPGAVSKLFEDEQMSTCLIRIGYHNIACIASSILKADLSGI